MAIRRYKSYKGVDINRDNDVSAPNVYLEGDTIGNGQGCGTLWFKSLEHARKFIDSGKPINIPKEMCLKCRCHYSFYSKEWKLYKDFHCREYKKNIVKLQ